MPQSHLLKKFSSVFNNCLVEELGVITFISGLFGGALLGLFTGVVCKLLAFPVNPYGIAFALGFCIGALIGAFKLSKSYAILKVERPDGYHRNLMKCYF